MDGHDPGRVVPAPALAEVASIWWDVDREPVVIWDEDARRIWLTDPGDPAGGDRLLLVESPTPLLEPRRIAEVLAEGLAACDFPPTGQRASAPRVEATLRAAGLEPGSASEGG